MNEDNNTPEAYPSKESPGNKKSRRRLGLYILIGLMALAIIIMILIWRPWEPSVKTTNRTVSVNGTATITATPDQYVFSPEYTFTESNQQTGLNELTQKSNQTIAKLKSLGVSNKDIQSNSNSYDNGGLYVSPNDSSGNTYTLDIQVKVNNTALAQKVQDYLLTTNPTGQVSPVAQFSNSMHQSLQNEARQKAEQDARTQADQSAKNLGFHLGAVKSVEDSNNTDFISAGLASGSKIAASAPQSHLSIQPGQNDLSYSVTVVYYIK